MRRIHLFVMLALLVWLPYSPSAAQTKLTAQQMGERATARLTFTEHEVDEYGPTGAYTRTQGSAFCVSRNGYFVTNEHVVSGKTWMMLTLLDKTAEKRSAVAHVIKVDKDHDLALLHADCSVGLQPLELAPAGAITEGMQVTAFGFPSQRYPYTDYIRDRAVQSSKGQVTALVGKGGVLSNIEVDTGFGPGASGGPVLNDRGQLVGVTRMVHVGTRTNLAISPGQVAALLGSADIQEKLAQPELQFDDISSIRLAERAKLGASSDLLRQPPPRIEDSRSFRLAEVSSERDFTARYVGPKGSLPNAKLTLTLQSAGTEPRTIVGTPTGDGFYRFHCALLKAAGPKALTLIAVRGGRDAAKYRVADKTIVLGNRTIKLSEMWQINQSAEAYAVLTSGEQIKGRIAGLDAIDVVSAGKSAPMSFAQIPRIVMRDEPDTPRSIDYKVNVTGAGKVAVQVAGSFPIGDVPARRLGPRTVVACGSAWPTNSTGIAGSHANDLSSSTVRYIRNITDYLTGAPFANILVWSNHWMYGAAFQEVLRSMGDTVTVSVEPGPLEQYDAVFVGGTPIDQHRLDQYVSSGGKVYVATGKDVDAGSRQFLTHYGIEFDDAVKYDSTTMRGFGSHPIYSDVTELTVRGLSSITTRIANPDTHLVAGKSGANLCAIYQPGDFKDVQPELESFRAFRSGLSFQNGIVLHTDARWSVIVNDAATGHDYCEVALTGPVTYEEAARFASTIAVNGHTGHLLTINSQQESEFVARMFPNALRNEVWLGAVRADPNGVATAGWRWSTGEPWGYTNWGAEARATSGASAANAIVTSANGSWRLSSTPSRNLAHLIFEFDEFGAAAKPPRTFPGIRRQPQAGAVSQPGNSPGMFPGGMPRNAPGVLPVRLPRVVASVSIGNSLSEKEHKLQEVNSETGVYNGYHWRHARESGWFSYEVKVLPDGTPQVVSCTYWGGDNNGREFNILVNGVIIASVTLNNNAPGRYFTVEYPIPAEVVNGKDSAVVRFQAHTGKYAGGIYGCQILRK